MADPGAAVGNHDHILTELIVAPMAPTAGGQVELAVDVDWAAMQENVGDATCGVPVGTYETRRVCGLASPA